MTTEREPPLRIGLSARLMHRVPVELGFRNKTLQYLEQSMAHWVIDHGALVFLVPTLTSGGSLKRSDLSVRDYVHALDGLILQGGADVSPMSYNEQPLQPEWQGDRVRDLYEIELLWEFLIQHKPVLGICRGAQLLNVAFGGTLWQDLATQLGTGCRHYDAVAYDDTRHPVSFVEGSWLGTLHGETSDRLVTSIHHQAVRQLGKDIVAEALSPEDGVIEAIRWMGSGFAVGVQWHPEFHTEACAHLLARTPLMTAFLDAVRVSRPAKV